MALSITYTLSAITAFQGGPKLAVHSGKRQQVRDPVDGVGLKQRGGYLRA